MIKFPSIEQYRTAVKRIAMNSRFVGRDENGDAIYDASLTPPTLKYRGTVKLHGTNAGIVYDVATDKIEYQSRERILTLEQDNAGFMLYMMQFPEITHDIVKQCSEINPFDNNVAKVCIYGEWCGKGIQKSVGISELPKMFVIFGVRVVRTDETSTWYPIGEFDIHYPEPMARVFNIDTFQTWDVEVDFANPHIAQNIMVDLTDEVEKECPVAKYFGVENGIGEGIVWTPCGDNVTSDGWFKVKGEKHSTSKVKTLNLADVEAIEKMNEFIEHAVTEARLEWALDNMQREKLLPFEMKSMGDFIRIVYNDVIKEESDLIVENQIDTKKLGSAVANKARPWFIKNFNEG